MATGEGRVCPRCGAALHVDEGWVMWCPKCEWNLSPLPDPKPRTRLERAYQRAGERMGARLRARLEASSKLEPRWTPSKVLAYAIALGVHLLTLALAVAAVLVLQDVNPFSLLLAVACAGLAFLMRPRLGSPPKDGVVTREQAPTLYAVVDEVAAAIDARPPHVIVVNGEFNAYWTVRGLRRRRVLGLGLPLLAVLEPQGRVALIGHELGHGRNGDAQRGLIVGAAVNALVYVCDALGPGFESTIVTSETIAGELIGNPLMWTLIRPFVWLLQLEAHLMWRDSQRAEYLADALAAKAGGTAAEIASHELSLQYPVVRAVAQRSVTSPTPGFDFFAELASAMRDVPQQERERRRRIARAEGARLDATHPPSGSRIALLEARPALEPAVVLGTARNARLEAELAPLREKLGPQILERFRSSMYAGGGPSGL